MLKPISLLIILTTPLAYTGQIPTLTQIAATQLGVSLHDKLNGHNWKEQDADLQKKLPAESYKQVQDCFCAYHGLRDCLNGYNYLKAPSWSIGIQSNKELHILATFNNTVQIHETQTGALKLTLDGLTGLIWELPSDDLLIIENTDRSKMQVWNTSTSKLIQTFNPQRDYVHSVSLEPGMQHCIAKHNDNMVHLWHFQSYKELLEKKSGTIARRNGLWTYARFLHHKYPKLLSNCLLIALGSIALVATRHLIQT